MCQRIQFYYVNASVSEKIEFLFPRFSFLFNFCFLFYLPLSTDEMLVLCNYFEGSLSVLLQYERKAMTKKMKKRKQKIKQTRIKSRKCIDERRKK